MCGKKGLVAPGHRYTVTGAGTSSPKAECEKCKKTVTPLVTVLDISSAQYSSGLSVPTAAVGTFHVETVGGDYISWAAQSGSYINYTMEANYGLGSRVALIIMQNSDVVKIVRLNQAKPENPDYTGPGTITLKSGQTYDLSAKINDLADKSSLKIVEQKASRYSNTYDPGHKNIVAFAGGIITGRVAGTSAVTFKYTNSSTKSFTVQVIVSSGIEWNMIFSNPQAVLGQAKTYGSTSGGDNGPYNRIKKWMDSRNGNSIQYGGVNYNVSDYGLPFKSGGIYNDNDGYFSNCRGYAYNQVQAGGNAALGFVNYDDTQWLICERTESQDYHYFRMNDDGTWSHRIGDDISNKVKNSISGVVNAFSDEIILDPQSAMFAAGFSGGGTIKPYSPNPNGAKVNAPPSATQNAAFSATVTFEQMPKNLLLFESTGDPVSFSLEKNTLSVKDALTLNLQVSVRNTGRRLIVLKDGNKILGDFQIQINSIPVTGLTLDKSTYTLNKLGDTVQLTANIQPSNATNKSVTWKSSDNTVATVSVGGKITALKSGQATITATAADGSGKKASATIFVCQYVSMRVGKTTAIQNGQKITIDNTGAKPFKIGGRTMLPVRFIGEKMGGTVKYVNDKTPIVITYGNKKVELTLGKKVMKVTENGKTTQIQIDVAAQKSGGRAYFPLRAISESLGFDVYYKLDGSAEYIIVSSSKMTADLQKQRIDEAKRIFMAN